MCSAEVLILKSTRARFGGAECDGRPGVTVHCHSLPSSPEMPNVSPFHPLEFISILIGPLTCPCLEPSLFQNFDIAITFRPCSALSDLTAYLPRRVSLSVVGVLLSASDVFFLIGCLSSFSVTRSTLSG